MNWINLIQLFEFVNWFSFVSCQFSLSFAQNFDQFGINGNGMAPGQASLYPFLPPPPPQPMNGGPPHGPGPHGPGHVHVPHPESELQLLNNQFPFTANL